MKYTAKAKRRRNNAVITIKGRQYYEEYDDHDNIELITDGCFEKQGDAYVISYDESEVTGLEGTRTMILVEPDNRVTMTRIGDTSSSLIFEQGKRNSSLYSVEEGELTLTVDAFKIINRLTDTGGSLFVDYQLELNSQIMSKNNFLLKIKEML